MNFVTIHYNDGEWSNKVEEYQIDMKRGNPMTKKDEAFKVVWPAIEVFPSMLTDEIELKEQAKKIIEEAAEIYSAIEDIYDEERIGWAETDRVIEECADCMTAVSNMIARIYMSWIRRRCGKYASDTINSLQMNEHVGRVRGKNFRRGHYDKDEQRFSAEYKEVSTDK